jgi:hypothetical protein
MGFSIIIGELVVNGEKEVFAEQDGSNVASMGYGTAEQFAEHYPDVWTCLRKARTLSSSNSTQRLST